MPKALRRNLDWTLLATVHQPASLAGGSSVFSPSTLAAEAFGGGDLWFLVSDSICLQEGQEGAGLLLPTQALA